MNKRVFITLSFALLLVFSACKSKQALSGKQQKAKSAEHFLTLVQAAEPKLKAVSATNVQLRFKQKDQNHKVTATLRMQCDSVIVLSISPFMGIELFSFELYPDKWIVYDKINRLYAVESYDYLFYAYGVSVDFYSLQSLFSAQLFGLEGRQLDARKSQLIRLDNNESALRYESEQFVQEVFVHNDYKLKQLNLKNKSDETELRINYADYIQKNQNQYPQDINFEIFKGVESQLVLNMKLQKISFDSQAKILLSKPERYSQVSFNQIIR